MGKAVVIESEESSPEVKETDIDTFLLGHPSGVYTVARTLHTTKVVDFNDHVLRLERSLKGKGILTSENSSLVDIKSQLSLAFGRLIKLSSPLLSNPSELRLTALVLSLQTNKLQFALMAEPLPFIKGPVAIEIWRAKRETPGVKDSEWVRTRLAMKHRTHSQPRVNEVVLQSFGDKDSLLEGLSSNFFIVSKAKEGNEIIQTAPEGIVLSGTVRSMLVDVCKELGITLDLSCPKESEALKNCWTGCFITSTTRLVLEVDEIRFIDEVTGNQRRETLKLGNVPHPLISRVSEALIKRLESVSVCVL